MNQAKTTREPFPLSWDEQQERLLAELPEYLRAAALFAVNAGCRDQEVRNLKWAWEHPGPELDTSVFIIPFDFLKEKKKGARIGPIGWWSSAAWLKV